MSFGVIFFELSSSCSCFLVNSDEIVSDSFFKLSYPCLPVKALAFRVLTNREKILLLFCFKFHLIFSDTIFDCVYTEA